MRQNIFEYIYYMCSLSVFGHQTFSDQNCRLSKQFWFCSHKMCSLCILYSAKLWRGKTLVNLAKRSSIANILPNQIPDSLIIIATNGSYCKFAKVFLVKTLKRSICQSFTPPAFCTIWYSTCCFFFKLNFS